MFIRTFLARSALSIAIGGLSLGLSTAQGATMSDKSFMNDAAHAGHYEIEAAHEAIATTQNEEVKEFAQMMIDEHQQVDKGLNELAMGKDIALPNEPSVVQKGKLLLLKGKDGHNFDTYYAEHLGVKAHKEAIELYEKQIDKGDDAEIVAFAQDALPILRQHLQHAEMLQRRVEELTPKN